jgi:hypothetical protein
MTELQPTFSVLNLQDNRRRRRLTSTRKVAFLGRTRIEIHEALSKVRHHEEAPWVRGRIRFEGFGALAKHLYVQSERFFVSLGHRLNVQLFQE